jgi:Uma2 family endonuclease
MRVRPGNFVVLKAMVMSTSPPASATLDDLYAVDGKAELIAGRIVKFMPSGFAPSRAAMKIAMRLDAYSDRTKAGLAFADGVGYALKRSLRQGRQSFCPDASYYIGPLPRNRMRFIDGVPALAVEVRSEGDYGESAETRLADKRADYFEAGTEVVWDVDPLARTVAVYRAAAPQQPDIYPTGQIADAEPALPGFRVPVDDIFS